MAIQRGLSVLGPETLWLDFPCVAFLLCPWITVSHSSFVYFSSNSTVVLLVTEFIGCRRKVHKTGKVQKCLKLPCTLTDTHVCQCSATDEKAAEWNGLLHCLNRMKTSSLNLVSQISFQQLVSFSCFTSLCRNENLTRTSFKTDDASYKLDLQALWIQRYLERL